MVRTLLPAVLIVAVAACGGSGGTPADPATVQPAYKVNPTVAHPTAEPTAGELALVDRASLPTTLMFFDHTTGVFLSVTVDPLHRDYGHFTAAIEGTGVAWSLAPGAIETGGEGGLTYSFSGPGRLDTAAMTDPVRGAEYALSGQLVDATLSVTLAVQPDLLTATAGVVLDGMSYMLTAGPPTLDAETVSNAVGDAMVEGDWLTIWEYLEADGQERFTPEHWASLGESFAAEFDSIDSAECAGIRYLVQPGVLPFRAFADTTVTTTSDGVTTHWTATQKLVWEQGEWRVESMGQMEEQ